MVLAFAGLPSLSKPSSQTGPLVGVSDGVTWIVGVAVAVGVRVGLGVGVKVAPRIVILIVAEAVIFAPLLDVAVNVTKTGP